MSIISITDATPIAMLTVGQLREVMTELINSAMNGNAQQNADAANTERFDSADYATGLRGICDMFGVSAQTAQKYKNTWLAPAVKQRGKKLFIDRRMAMELFGQRSENQ